MKIFDAFSLIFLLGLASALSNSTIQRKLRQQYAGGEHNCYTPFDRIRGFPINYELLAVGSSPYTDPLFRAEVSSLYWSGFNDLGYVSTLAYDLDGWKRLGEIYPDFQLFSDRFEPNDVKQGALRDS